MVDIKRLAAEMQIKQKELGVIMGVTQPQVSAIIQGRKSLLEVHEIRLKSHFGDKIDKYITNTEASAQTDNKSINPKNSEAMDPLAMAMDYINTLKTQLAEQNELIRRLTAKEVQSDDEVLSRSVGAIQEKQDELKK